ncbi:MAG TPA: Uma2 family endonuclease [Candidatus Krumholzibacteria bacterium]|jgi:Uma2 family endonuclease
MTIQMVRHLFTVSDLRRMVEAGIFAEDDRVELVEGEIVEMPPIGSHHSDVADVLTEMFASLAREIGFMTRIQGPIKLDESSQLQPDIALLRRRGRAYRESLPPPDEILLVVEVSDSTLISDQRVKAPLYARHGIPELWIVNLTSDSIEVYREPSVAGYSSRTISGRGEVVSPLAFPTLSFAVDDILG